MPNKGAATAVNAATVNLASHSAPKRAKLTPLNQSTPAYREVIDLVSDSSDEDQEEEGQAQQQQAALSTRVADRQTEERKSDYNRRQKITRRLEADRQVRADTEVNLYNLLLILHLHCIVCVALVNNSTHCIGVLYRWTVQFCVWH